MIGCFGNGFFMQSEKVIMIFFQQGRAGLAGAKGDRGDPGPQVSIKYEYRVHTGQ